MDCRFDKECSLCENIKHGLLLVAIRNGRLPTTRLGGEKMQIRPTNNVNTTQAINLQTRNTTEKSSNQLPVDQLDISAEAQLMNVQSASDCRADRIADIRAQIAQGQYETADKLDVAMSRLFDQIV